MPPSVIDMKNKKTLVLWFAVVAASLIAASAMADAAPTPREDPQPYCYATDPGQIE